MGIDRFTTAAADLRKDDEKVLDTVGGRIIIFLEEVEADTTLTPLQKAAKIQPLLDIINGDAPTGAIGSLGGGNDGQFEAEANQAVASLRTRIANSTNKQEARGWVVFCKRIGAGELNLGDDHKELDIEQRAREGVHQADAALRRGRAFEALAPLVTRLKGGIVTSGTGLLKKEHIADPTLLTELKAIDVPQSAQPTP